MYLSESMRNRAKEHMTASNVLSGQALRSSPLTTLKLRHNQCRIMISIMNNSSQSCSQVASLDTRTGVQSSDAPFM